MAERAANGRCWSTKREAWESAADDGRKLGALLQKPSSKGLPSGATSSSRPPIQNTTVLRIHATRRWRATAQSAVPRALRQRAILSPSRPRCCCGQVALPKVDAAVRAGVESHVDVTSAPSP